MMRFLGSAILLALSISVAAGAQPVIHGSSQAMPPTDRPLPTHVVGRVASLRAGSASPAGPANRHQWPAIYWEAAFSGDRLHLAFDDDKNAYRLTVDDEPPVSLAQPAKVVTVTGLGPGRHRVRLDKVTESVDFIRTFGGFYVPSATAVRPAPPPRRRRIEFFGDSGMTGYGIGSTSRECTKEQVRLLTDSTAAWPARVARHFEADYQINAMSGRGLVRNYGGGELDRTMSALYARTLPDEAGTWRDPTWQPQIVVVMLFADFVTDLAPGERWPDQAALVADYTRAYRRLVENIHARAPAAALVLPWIDFSQYHDDAARLLGGRVQADIRSAAAAAGIMRIEFPVLPGFVPEQSACDWHGSRADHRQMAEWMEAWIAARPDLWGR